MKPRQNKQPEGQRQLRVGEQIRHVLAQTMREGRFHDEALLEASLITVTEVRIGADLKNATAFVMPLGGKNAEPVLQALNRAAPYFQAQVGHELRLKYTPHILFKLDTSFDEAERIERLIAGLHSHDQTTN